MSNYADERHSATTSTSQIPALARIMLTAALLLSLLSTTVHAQQRERKQLTNNQDYIHKGLETFADTILSQAALQLALGRISLQVESPRYADKLTNTISESLQARFGVDVYLSPRDSADMPRMETKLDVMAFSYVGVGRGLLRFPAVRRVLQLGGYGRVLDAEGKLLTTITVADLVFSDTLSYADAEAATGDGPFLSPPLPPSPYRRLVEPGLVLTITGALVYLFFASR